MSSNRVCNKCKEQFIVSEADLLFYEKVSPVIGGQRFEIPEPNLCAECRLQRRLAFRNQIYMHVRTDSRTSARIYSAHTAEAPFPVFDNDYWWGDSWDALEYGRPFDFTRPFFSQFDELQNKVPRIARIAQFLENTDYCNNAAQTKNSYLVFSVSHIEDSLYIESANYVKDCIDCTQVYSSELCYDCVECTDCYNLQNSQFCEHCSDSYYLFNCRGCHHCIGCANLRNKSYCIYNEQYSKDEFDRFLSKLKLSSHQAREELQESFWRLIHNTPRPHLIGSMIEDVSGNIIRESKNAHESFLVRRAQDCRFCFASIDLKDCYDLTFFGLNAELLYECAGSGINTHNLQFCNECWNGSSNLLYCAFCSGCEHCFGCVGLKRKKFCILNKQYSETEYHEIVGKIVEHMRNTREWGEFFPLELSSIPYNLSLAHRYFPLTEDDANLQGLGWYTKNQIDSQSAIPAGELPDELPDSNVPIVVLSELSGKPFRITSEEILRYRQFCIPLPRLTYDERMQERARHLGGIRLHDRDCRRSEQQIRTVWSETSVKDVWDRQVFEQEYC